MDRRDVLAFLDQSSGEYSPGSGQIVGILKATKDAMEDAEEEAVETEKFIATLETQCATKEKEWAERSKMRAMEVSAISEAIEILNDDDALDIFKKASGMPSAMIQAQVGFLQRSNGKASNAHKAQAIL